MARDMQKYKKTQAAWRAANREKLLAEKKAWYAAHKEDYAAQKRQQRVEDPEGVRAEARAKYSKNKDKILLWQKEWRAKIGPEHFSKKNKAYLASHGAEVRERKRERYVKSPARWMLASARQRAKKAGVPITITAHDIEIPDFCPVFGVRLEVGAGKALSNSPSLDRIRPELGYIPGNIRVISWRANFLKSNGTAEEFDMISAYIRSTQ